MKTTKRRTRIGFLAACMVISSAHGATARAQTASTIAVPSAAPGVSASASPSLSGEVNDYLPSWLRFGGEYRFRFEGRTGVAGRDEQDDAYALSRLRLNLTFSLGKHWRLFVEGQDSQVGGYNVNPDPSSLQDDFDLRQGWIEYRQKEKAGWSVRLGRQEISYGDQRVVGAANWGNVGRTFDAAKLSYVDSRVAVDAFASSVVVPQDDVFDKHFDGQNFYGTHASFFKVVPRAELNAYAYWKTAPLVIDERARAGDADTVTFGGRLTGKLTKRADYTAELIGQRGSFGGDEIRGAAAHGRFGYVLVTKGWAPKLRLEYNYASGDASPGDGVRGTYDQLYPTNHDKYGIVDVIGYRNLHNARAGVAIKPHAKVTVEADYNSFWLAHRRDGLYSEAGALVARIASGAPDAHIAHEASVQGVLTIRDGLALAAGYGRWIPGSFWKATTPGASQDFVYSSMTYRF
jgi:hypothetical protein